MDNSNILSFLMAVQPLFFFLIGNQVCKPRKVADLWYGSHVNYYINH